MPKKQRNRRRRGDGSVTVARRDALGRPILWKASISLGAVTIDGKRRRNRPTEYAATKPEAYELLKRLQAKHLTGDDLAPNKQTVEAFLLRWLEHVKTVRSRGTYGVYESRCRVHIIPAIGGLKLRSLKTAHVQTLLDGLATHGLAPGMVRGVRAILVKALNTARKWGDLRQGAPNVAADTEIPAVIEKKPPSLNDAQLERLLKVISGDPIEPLILVALGTGYRLGECLGLLWANVDEDAQLLSLTGAIKRYRRDGSHPGAQYENVRESFTKTHDERMTHLAASVADALKQQGQIQQQQRQAAGSAWEVNGLIFTDVVGHPLSLDVTSKRFKQLAKQASLPPDFTFHSLRHSCVTFLIKQGENQRTLMEVLGHKSLRASQRYGQVLPEVSRDALDKLGQRLTRRGGEK